MIGDTGWLIVYDAAVVEGADGALRLEGTATSQELRFTDERLVVVR